MTSKIFSSLLSVFALILFSVTPVLAHGGDEDFRQEARVRIEREDDDFRREFRVRVEGGMDDAALFEGIDLTALDEALFGGFFNMAVLDALGDVELNDEDRFEFRREVRFDVDDEEDEEDLRLGLRFG